MKINKITAKNLREMYIERKMSSPEIGQIYHCRPEYIRYLLRKYKIKIRTKSEALWLQRGVLISKATLRKLYQKEKMSAREIAEKLRCGQTTIINRLKQYNIPIRTTQEAHVLAAQPTYKRTDFNGNLTEKAYLIGFRLGDLHVSRTNQYSSIIRVNTNSTQPEQIQLVEQLFSPYGYIWKGKPDKQKAVTIRCFLNQSFTFLLEKKDLIEPWILKNKNYFAAFLAGYIDAEGSFCLCGGDAVFSIKSQDRNILQQIRAKLIELGVLCRPSQIARRAGEKDIRGVKNNKDIWAVFIYRKDALLKLMDLINSYLKHAKRRKNMELVKNNIIWRNKKYNNHQTSKWDKLYLKEKINYVRPQPLVESQASEKAY